MRNASLNITSEALIYWMNELANRTQSTRNNYLKDFSKFLDYAGKTADELLAQHQENQTSRDMKTQRQTESLLEGFIASEEKKGCAPATLLKKTQDIYKENKRLQCLLETAPIMGIDAYNMAYSAVLSKGKLEQVDISLMFAIQMQKILTPDELKQLITILKKYPELPIYQQLKEKIEQFEKNLPQTLKELKDAIT